MCPMCLLPKLFLFDDGEVPPELCAHRTFNLHRVPEIARYLVLNRTSYVALSAITTASRISKPKSNIRLTANLLKTHMGLNLTSEEHALEQNLVANRG